MGQFDSIETKGFGIRSDMRQEVVFQGAKEENLDSEASDDVKLPKTDELNQHPIFGRRKSQLHSQGNVDEEYEVGYHQPPTEASEVNKKQKSPMDDQKNDVKGWKKLSHILAPYRGKPRTNLPFLIMIS